ncbi:MAG: LacI family DNA-binding transcriptional regulator, partial [Caldilineaceae bacterium]|nr:LacI family DNA-binding transcriptional regulator [Caldilineaceae bacterium]
EGTRRRVFAAMDELGYRPHALARGLASKRSRILAFLFPTSERGLGSTDLEFITGAADGARSLGYHLVLWSSDSHEAAELHHLLQQGLVDGVVLMEVHLDDARIAYLREIKFPFSIVGRCTDLTDLSYVDIDFEQTVREAVTYLVQLGHTHIGFFNHGKEQFDAGYGPSVRTQLAFEHAVQEAGVHGVSRFCNAAPQAGYAGFNAMLKECPQLTALASLNERIVPGLMRAITDRGWTVPDDMSLIALVSSVRVAEMSTPPLTTLAPPAAELGRLGVELLVQQLEGLPSPVSSSLLPCRLVLGGSTSVPRPIAQEKQA